MLGDDQCTHMENTFAFMPSKKWHKGKKSAGRGSLGIIWPRCVPLNFIQMDDSLLKNMQLATKGWILAGHKKIDSGNAPKWKARVEMRRAQTRCHYFFSKADEWLSVLLQNWSNKANPSNRLKVWFILITRSLGAPPGAQLLAGGPSGLLTLSFKPFGRSGRYVRGILIFIKFKICTYACSQVV